MNYTVMKRNGTIVPFESRMIANAIYKAVLASHTQEELRNFDTEVLEKLVADVVLECKNITDVRNESLCINIEDIQDIVERTLIKNGFADTAKAYILYRKKRDEIRSTKDSISKTISDVLMSDSKDSDTKRENANIDGNTAMGTMLQIGSNVSKKFYINNMMSYDIAKAYTDGYIHIHDLDFYKLTVTCCQIDFEKLAKDGFNTGHGYLREPQSIGAYATLAAIAIQSNQSDCHGGQSIPNFDYSMTPGIYKSFRKALRKNTNKYKRFAGENVDKEVLETIDLILEQSDGYIDLMIYEKNSFLNPSLHELMAITREDVERECYQAMEGFVHNLNTLHSRAGAQVNKVA